MTQVNEHSVEPGTVLSYFYRFTSSNLSSSSDARMTPEEKKTGREINKTDTNDM